MRRMVGVAILAAALLSLAASAQPGRYFVVQVLDDTTGRGVPLVELRTNDHARWYTDSSGLAAIDEPGLADRSVFFTIRSHGYEAAADGFGMRGVALKVQPGGGATVKIKRLNIAERLYRVTGAGIYRDTVLAGKQAPIREPLLNGQVMGCDSVQTAIYQGKMFWMWGDTFRPSYPLGNYHMTGATSALPGKGGLDPDRGIDFDYFVGEDGFARGMAPVPGEGPTWLDGLVALPEGGRERLFAAYSKIKNQLEVYERGLVRFEDEKGRFERIEQFAVDAPIIPHGHPSKRTEGGREYVYFGDPFPLVRVAADAASLRDLSRYEAYTCLKEGSSLKAPVVDRDKDGKVRYSWRRNAPAVNPESQEELFKTGKLTRDEALIRLKDAATGKRFVAHRGTVQWNEYRKRWILITGEIYGTSLLGELWYAEAPTPLGPWVEARKIVTHDRYSFYNPMHHPEFDQDGGRKIYFEGTYTHSFSGNPEPTPRYDYNQVMYRLDLADPRLHGTAGPER
jgi:hypothetical protein